MAIIKTGDLTEESVQEAFEKHSQLVVPEIRSFGARWFPRNYMGLIAKICPRVPAAASGTYRKTYIFGDGPRASLVHFIEIGNPEPGRTFAELLAGISRTYEHHADITVLAWRQVQKETGLLSCLDLVTEALAGSEVRVNLLVEE